MKDLNILKNKVLIWAKKKGILDKATPKDQFTKTIEEVGEIAAGICRNDRSKIQDSIGDVAVTLIILAELYSMDFTECLDVAYNEISGRKGEMKDGVFVKEE